MSYDGNGPYANYRINTRGKHTEFRRPNHTVIMMIWRHLPAHRFVLARLESDPYVGKHRAVES